MSISAKRGSGHPLRSESKDATETEKRPERIPVSGQGDILTVRGKDPAYEYRWILDKHESGQRVLRFKDAGYDFVEAKDGVGVGQNHVYKSENVGSLIRVPAGQEGEFLYLMRQHKDWYNADQTAKQEQILDTERELTRRPGENSGNDSGQYGSVSINN